MHNLQGQPLDFFLEREWIVSNGIGGYASSSLAGVNTRRYHGILVASLNPPVERRLTVSKVEEGVWLDSQFFRLSTNEYPDTFYPQGYQHIHSFERNPFPRTLFKLGTAELSKTLWMVHQSNTTVVEYHNHSPFALQVWLNPLYSFRDFHKTVQERGDHKYKVKYMGRTQAIKVTDDSPTVYFKHSEGIFKEGRTWNKNLQFRIDRSRGTEHTEDVYSLGHLEHTLQPGESLYLLFSTDPKMSGEQPEKLKQSELARLNSLTPQNISNEFLRDLIRSGDQFLVHRSSTKSHSVIAGYHWFSDWGRDSMIALRGLCIEQGKEEAARSVISTFLSYLDEGLIPNRFPDYEGEHLEYNTADATLWLFIAVYEYSKKFGGQKFVKTVLPKLRQILDAHIAGTKHNIQMLSNGLLSGGSEDIQITWMDAKLGDKVFTPRNGCAVEINALWYNALMIYSELAEDLGNKSDKKLAELAGKVKREFNKVFWNEKGYLNDVVNGQSVDESVRPNQVFALSLPFTLLPLSKEKKVLETIRQQLVTPMGLRTLAPSDIAFRPHYHGNWLERDEAYHQGTVWPFLLPEYCLAYLRVNKQSKKALAGIRDLLQPLKQHFYQHECLHGISEVFDGLEPGKGKGCAHQAWSVSQLILLLMKSGIQA